MKFPALIALTVLLMRHEARAQVAQRQNYFQQELHYHLRVFLDDRRHLLHGQLTMQYFNHSPDSLPYLYFHLYPNAYSNHLTAFARQQVENGSIDFYYSPDSSRGFLDSLQFLADGAECKTETDSLHIEVVKVFLPRALAPGEQIEISTPFRVKIPHTFSRLGHIGQQYQVSQWYPKPAVYDAGGWQTMPYLDLGEFYSEFARYEVEITLPANYVVGATGELTTMDEHRWLKQKAAETQSQIDSLIALYSILSKKEVKKNSVAPPSADKLKTLRYVAERVHDFAWFADKNYLVMQSRVLLPASTKPVATMALFTPENALWWKKATSYTDSALLYFSKNIGHYPYPQMTVVNGALSAGGGMEYPMVTVISGIAGAKLLDGVIAHEIAHNWFYGMLAFNERAHPWMDEGLTSYYENRYLQHRYPDDGMLPDTLDAVSSFFDLHYPAGYQNYLFYLIAASRRNDQPPSLPSQEFTKSNFGISLYAKTPCAFHYLEKTIGPAAMDACIQSFFENWKFRHPGPEDFFLHLSQCSDDTVVSWFRSLIETKNYLDYKITGEEVGLTGKAGSIARLKVVNRQTIPGPFTVTAFASGAPAVQQSYQGFAGKKVIHFPDGGYDYFRIDAAYQVPELHRGNNFYRRHGLFRHTEPLRLQALGSIDNPARSQIFFAPVLGFNKYDGLLPGLALYNFLLTPKKVNALLLPQFGIHSKKMTGTAEISVPFYLRKTGIHSVTFTSSFRSYTFDEVTFGTADPETFDRRYLRFTQWIKANLRKKDERSSVSQQLYYRHLLLRKQEISSPGQNTTSLPYSNTWFNQAGYTYYDRRVINPFDFTANIEAGNGKSDDYLKIFTEGNFVLSYPRKKTGIRLRAFAGLFLNAPVSEQFRFRLSASTGSDDYLFDDIFFGRSETAGFYSQQISSGNDGGFATRTNSSSPRIGESAEWLLSVNLKVPVPVFTPLFVFANGGFAPSPDDVSSPGYNVFQYDAGVGLTLLPRIIEVYLPLAFSPDMRGQLLPADNFREWYQRISFRLSLEQINPFDWITRIAG
jgi:hypothetical protein